MKMFQVNSNKFQFIQRLIDFLFRHHHQANINLLLNLHHKLVTTWLCIDADESSFLLRRKGTTSSPQMVVWNKQNPLEEHLSHPLSEARSSSSSSSNQSEHAITRTGSSPLAVPGRRYVSWYNLISQSKSYFYTHTLTEMCKFWMITRGTVL